MKKIGLPDVKIALKDHRFRDSLPEPFKSDLSKYLQNPACPCNVPFYRKLLKEAKSNLMEYYTNGVVEDVDDEEKKLSENAWTVINCHISELEGKLKRLPLGRKQIAITRFEDQITCVVNELDLAF